MSANPGEKEKLMSEYSAEQQERAAGILVAHYDRNDIQIIRQHCEKVGYVVYVASNCEEAMQVVNGKLVDVIIVYWSLPEGGAIELIRLINQNPKTSNVSIILLGAGSPEGNRRPGDGFSWDSKLPVRWFMSKPLAPKFLENVIAKIVQPHDVAVQAAENWEQYRTESVFGPNVR